MLQHSGIAPAGGEPVRPRTVIAVSTGHPFHPATFSGYSARLFATLDELGMPSIPVSSKTLSWRDVFTGALGPGSLRRDRAEARRSSVINPNWYWSRRGFDRFCRRFDARLSEMEGPLDVVQIGTHVMTSRTDTRLFCVTDCTVAQGLRSGGYSVCRASQRVIREALECQALVLHRSFKVFTLSRWAAESVVDDYGVPADRVIVVGAGANLNVPAAPVTESHEPYALFVGYSWEQKGGPLLLDAFRLARRQVPSCRLKIVGCEPPVGGPGIDVIGRLRPDVSVEQQTLADLYAGASCLAILSTADAFPNVVLEAGAHGIPVVALDAGSRREAVVDGVTGFLVREPLPAAVADPLVRLLSDPGLVRRIGSAARDHVRAHFTWPQVARRVMTAMREEL